MQFVFFFAYISGSLLLSLICDGRIQTSLRDLAASADCKSKSQTRNFCWINFCVKVLCFLWRNLSLPLKRLIHQMTNRCLVLLFFFFFSRKQELLFHANCLHCRQFAWNVKSCLLGENTKTFQYVVCWSLLIELYIINFLNICLNCSYEKNKVFIISESR